MSQLTSLTVDLTAEPVRQGFLPLNKNENILLIKYLKHFFVTILIVCSTVELHYIVCANVNCCDEIKSIPVSL